MALISSHLQCASCSCRSKKVFFSHGTQLVISIKQALRPLSLPIGPLHNLVTWYKITHACQQVALWNFQNNATHTSPPGHAFVLEIPLRNLLTSMCDFVHVTGSCKGPIIALESVTLVLVNGGNTSLQG